MTKIQGNYHVYKLSDGKIVKFMCYNKEWLEMYKNVLTGEVNIVREIDRKGEGSGMWHLTDGEKWGKREVPLFGVKIMEVLPNAIF